MLGERNRWDDRSAIRFQGGKPWLSPILGAGDSMAIGTVFVHKRTVLKN
jgi:hypothetical protein